MWRDPGPQWHDHFFPQVHRHHEYLKASDVSYDHRGGHDHVSPAEFDFDDFLGVLALAAAAAVLWAVWSVRYVLAAALLIVAPAALLGLGTFAWGYRQRHTWTSRGRLLPTVAVVTVVFAWFLVGALIAPAALPVDGFDFLEAESDEDGLSAVAIQSLRGTTYLSISALSAAASVLQAVAVPAAVLAVLIVVVAVVVIAVRELVLALRRTIQVLRLAVSIATRYSHRITAAAVALLVILGVAWGVGSATGSFFEPGQDEVALHHVGLVTSGLIKVALASGLVVAAVAVCAGAVYGLVSGIRWLCAPTRDTDRSRPT